MLYYAVLIIFLPLFICLFPNYSSYETEKHIRYFNSFSVIRYINQDKSHYKVKGVQRSLAALYRKKRKQKNIQTIEDVEKQFSNAYLISNKKELEDYRLNPTALVLHLTENILIKGEEHVVNDVNHLYAEVMELFRGVDCIVHGYNNIATMTRFLVDSIFQGVPKEVTEEIKERTNSFEFDFFMDTKKLCEYIETLRIDSEHSFDMFVNEIQIDSNILWFSKIMNNIRLLLWFLQRVIKISNVYAIRSMNVFPLRFCYSFDPYLNEENENTLEHSLSGLFYVFIDQEHLYFKSGNPMKIQYFENFEREIKNLQFMLDIRLKKRANELLKHLSRVIKIDAIGIICLFADIISSAEGANAITKEEFVKVFRYTNTWVASGTLKNLNGKERNLVFNSSNFLEKFVKSKLHHDLHTNEIVCLRKSLKESNEYENILSILSEVASVLLLKKRTEYLLKLFNYLREKKREKTSDKLRRFFNRSDTVLPNYVKFKHYLKFKRNVEYCNYELAQHRTNRRDKEFILEQYGYAKFLEQYLSNYSTLLHLLVIAFKKVKTNPLDKEEKNKQHKILLVTLFLVKKISRVFNS